MSSDNLKIVYASGDAVADGRDKATNIRLYEDRLRAGTATSASPTSSTENQAAGEALASSTAITSSTTQSTASPTKPAQDLSIGASCNLSVTDVTDKSAFTRFDAALRKAVSENDVKSLAALVSFPLTFESSSEGTITIADTITFQKQFAKIFTDQVRSAIMLQKTDQQFCRDTGITYTDDKSVWVWVTPTGNSTNDLRVSSVIIESPQAIQKSSDGTLALVCSTKKFLIQVTEDVSGTAHYKGWTKPHTQQDPPSLELTGTRGASGTGLCAHRAWEFKSGNVLYSVNGPQPCEPDEPANVKGQLIVTIGGQEKLNDWCF